MADRPMRIEIRPGAFLWRQELSDEQQESLLVDVMARIGRAPFYRPRMPRTGRPLSVEMSNFGPLGWVTDVKGYRYEPAHPVTAKPWPEIPPTLLKLWDELARYRAPPEACLVNRYRDGARMGLHQDRDEAATDAPVLSVSLGDEAIFRIGPPAGGRTASIVLNSGDVLLMGGPARFCRHGIDRIRPGSSRLIPGGGRLNLTLRRVTVLTETAGQGI